MTAEENYNIARAALVAAQAKRSKAHGEFFARTWHAECNDFDRSELDLSDAELVLAEERHLQAHKNFS